MRSKEELSALKNEVEALNKKLRELTGDELKQVCGGIGEVFNPFSEGNDEFSPEIGKSENNPFIFDNTDDLEKLAIITE